MLGGRSVVMSEGRIVQQGPTLEVYHNPSRVEVGQVFSDPPLNLIAGQVRDGAARLGESLTLPLDGHLGGLPPGGYRFGVRANHLGVKRAGAEDLEFRAVVELSEISGSETFIHARHSGVSWVVQEEGGHSLALGQSLSVFVNPRQIFVFDSDGKLVAAPPRGSVGPAPQ